MKYYVMSAKSERGCPITLTDDAALFDKYHENASLKSGYGHYPWYMDPYNCDLPVGACLITKSKEYYFDIRGLAGNLYVASDDFVSALKIAGYADFPAQPISVISKSGKDASQKSYSLIRVPLTNMQDALDKNNSKYSIEGVNIWVDKFEFNPSMDLPIVKIKNLNPFQDTLFCSEEFLTFPRNKQPMQGINIFELGEASWRNPNNPLAYLFVENYDPNNEVFPI